MTVGIGGEVGLFDAIGGVGGAGGGFTADGAESVFIDFGRGAGGASSGLAIVSGADVAAITGGGGATGIGAITGGGGADADSSRSLMLVSSVGL